ncbi:hypothetical protein [Serratia bockelmannii]|uniref:hypothetical protein n=1 Tax=Serratia bockelmannii TaxID=2703793 RepID=UPI0033163BB4
MTLTTTEELKHLASSDNANELTRRLARELLANREAAPVFWIRRMRLSGSVAITRDKSHAETWEREGLEVTPLYTATPAPVGEVVVTRNERGDIVAVTRQDGEGRVIEVIAESNAPPAPAMPEEMTGGIAMSKYKVKKSNYVQWVKGWNSCRAAMLAQPVSSGYKLVPAEATEDMIAAAMNCDDVSFNADETFCVNFGNIYAAMLAAAPEGGNDHDTRR